MDEEAPNTYRLRPNFKNKFRPAVVKDMIKEILKEQLHDKEYSSEEANVWTKTISDGIKERLKDFGYDRYKFVVQVVIGEQRGAGVQMGCRCFWDSDTDNQAHETFMNDTLFSAATAYGIFYY
ncbi:dynein light chain Tctex-type protein 2B-like [Oscarella lobularis]|uniref:dynein light chain Tctex-type protein 2B-like n=1 Tax=Oscarella lobularis TaxID=121494 RepID=UPI00331321F6